MRGANVSAWETLVFEVMSQQTPVSRVQPAWESWIRRWPEPGDLAAASRGDVLVAWDRLGYPSRAVRLHECARAITADFDGEVPADFDDLLALPGIGPYTASAVASFSYHRRVAVLDTNVRRVLMRAEHGRESVTSSSPSRMERDTAENLLPEDGADAAAWNVALMELGALVCTQRAPRCTQCPLADACRWNAEGRPPSQVVRRTQGFAGTDRQARGRIMARLRSAHVEGSAVTRAEALHAAALPEGADDQPARVLESLLADGLVTEDPGSGDLRLPD